MRLREAIARRKIARALPELRRPYDPSWVRFSVWLNAAAVAVMRQRFLVVKHKKEKVL